MTTIQRRFLIFDDDPQNNLLSRIALKKTFADAKVIEFVLPEIGLEYIRSEFVFKPVDEKTTLFLDLNMPTMTGWEFLEKFATLEETIKKQIQIYILSSSVDPRDLERAKTNPLIRDFIEKPLNKKTLLKLFFLEFDHDKNSSITGNH